MSVTCLQCGVEHQRHEHATACPLRRIANLEAELKQAGSSAADWRERWNGMVKARNEAISEKLCLASELEQAQAAMAELIEMAGRACEDAAKNNACQGREYLATLYEDMKAKPNPGQAILAEMVRMREAISKCINWIGKSQHLHDCCHVYNEDTRKWERLPEENCFCGRTKLLAAGPGPATTATAQANATASAGECIRFGCLIPKDPIPKERKRSKMKTNHSPLPWTREDVAGCADIYDAEGTEIAYVSGCPIPGDTETGEDRNADFIVLACNTHDELLEACKSVRNMALEFFPKNRTYGLLIAQLDATIAKAEGK